jgi:hypothetical protein
MPVISELEGTAEGSAEGSAEGTVVDTDPVGSAEDTVGDMYPHSQDTELDTEALAEEPDMEALAEVLDMEALAEDTEVDTPDRYLLLLSAEVMVPDTEVEVAVVPDTEVEATDTDAHIVES